MNFGRVMLVIVAACCCACLMPSRSSARRLWVSGGVFSFPVERRYLVENLTTGTLTEARETGLNQTLSYTINVESDATSGLRRWAVVILPAWTQLSLRDGFNRDKEKTAPSPADDRNATNEGDRISYVVSPMPVEFGASYCYPWKAVVLHGGAGMGWMFASVDIERTDALWLPGSLTPVEVVQRDQRFIALPAVGLRIGIDSRGKFLGLRWGLWGSAGMTWEAEIGDVPNTALNAVSATPNRDGGLAVLGGTTWSAGWRVSLR